MVGRCAFHLFRRRLRLLLVDNNDVYCNGFENMMTTTAALTAAASQQQWG